VDIRPAGVARQPRYRPRAEATARYKQEAIDRIDFGIELQHLRSAAGLTQNEMSAILQVGVDILRRAENGRPVGRGVGPQLRAGYSAAAKMAVAPTTSSGPAAATSPARPRGGR
jgi:hypothetical protein